MQVRLKIYGEGGPRCNHCKDYTVKEEFSHRTQICQCKKLKAHEHTATKSEHRLKHTCKHITSEWQNCATQAWHTHKPKCIRNKKICKTEGARTRANAFHVNITCIYCRYCMYILQIFTNYYMYILQILHVYIENSPQILHVYIADIVCIYCKYSGNNTSIYCKYYMCKLQISCK